MFFDAVLLADGAEARDVYMCVRHE